MGQSRNEWLTIANMSTGVNNAGSTVSVQRDICVPCPTNCRTCNYDICLFCHPGYSYMEGTCVKTCPSGFYSGSGVCLPCQGFGNCLACNPSGCTSCASGLTKVQGVCQPDCIHAPVTTTTTDPVTNTTVTTTTGTCSFNCTSPCDTCFGSGADQCVTCLSSYHLSGSNCVSTCPLGQY